MNRIDAIRLSLHDNVATVLRTIQAGDTLAVGCGDAVSAIVAQQPVPLCHKISLAAIPPAAAVVKYGQKIGQSVVSIAPGQHVHVHNMRSARAKVSA